MAIPLSILFIEDSKDDIDLMLFVLSKSQYAVEWEQVYTEAALRKSLVQREWDIVLCDYIMPAFDGPRALALVREHERNVPFIFVSGAIGEDVAVEAMQAGAQDYVMKHNLKRLVPAIERALRDAVVKRDRNRMQERLSFLAHHDPLTGLANRSLFLDHLSLAIHDAHRYNNIVAVAFIDLDKFKQINDTYGHDAGDEIIKAVASRVSGCLRRSDTVARLSGDEFAVVLGKLEHSYDISRVAQNILDQFKTPVLVNGAEIFARLSMGIAVYPTDGTNSVDLLRYADMAMYRAKHEGGGYQYFTEEMQTSLQRRTLAESTLQRALERDDLFLQFEPIVSVAERRVTAMATQLGWRTETGVRMAADFLDLAEQSGLIVAIGDWALRKAAEHCLDWRRRGYEFMRFTIRMSRKEFQRYNIFELIKTTLESVGLDPTALELEVSEETLAGNEPHVLRSLRRLREIGVTLAIDDFGLGYSSLGHLRQLPIDVLKIGQGFIQQVVDNKDDRNIVKAIVGMAECLRITVVAKGVETQAQVDVLRDVGCQYLQGRFFCEPVAPDRVCDWLNTFGEVDPIVRMSPQ